MGLTVFGLFVLPQRKSWPDLILQKKKSPGPLAASPALLNFFRFSSVVSTVVSQKKKKLSQLVVLLRKQFLLFAINNGNPEKGAS